MKEWLFDGAPLLILIDQITKEEKKVDNLNKKTYVYPIISKSDIVKAYKWNCLNKIHLKDDDFFYLCSDKKSDISKDECKKYNESLIEKNLVNIR